MFAIRNALVRLGALALLLMAMQARATTIQVDIDTVFLGLDGQNWDLAFDLVDGNPQPNSVTISSFSITGGALTGNAPFYPSTGNVTGDLSVPPGIVTMNDYDPAPSSFNEYTHNADLGSLITFVFEVSGNIDPGFPPDAFSFFFINPADGSVFPTADPTGALFVYNIGNEDQPVLYCPQKTGCVTATAVPEPGVLALAMAALIAMGALRRFRKRLA